MPVLRRPQGRGAMRAGAPGMARSPLYLDQAGR